MPKFTKVTESEMKSKEDSTNNIPESQYRCYYSHTTVYRDSLPRQASQFLVDGEISYALRKISAFSQR